MAADAAAESEGAQPTSVWERLRIAVDEVRYRPKLRDGLVWRELQTARGEDYVIIQNPRAATYLRLPPEDYYVFGLMDGTRSIQDLVVAYMLKFRSFALQRVVRLVQGLRDNEFLEDPAYYTFPQLRRRAKGRSLRTVLDDAFGFYLNREFPINGIDGMLDGAYRGGVWVLFTRPAQVVIALATLLGVPLLLYYLFSQQFSLFPEEELGRNLVAYYLSFTIIASAHELSHAFTVKANGRVVRRGGFCIFFGFPGVFVDTQDIWMEGRLPRIAVSWAGPYSGFVLAGLAGLVLVLAPSGPWESPLRLFGTVALVANLFQLMPLIQLDGYFILMDWLEIPLLRRRALAFIRHDLWAKIWRRQSLNREERVFAIFGLLAAAYTTYAIMLAGSFWWNHARAAILSALQVPSLGSLLGAVLVVLLVFPFAFGVVTRLIDLARTGLQAARRAGGAARERWYRQRIAMIKQVPALASLGQAQVEALAGRLREERFAAGAAVVREGDRGDRFYLIVDGHAEVVHARPEREHVVATLGPLDYFGEHALLHDAPRAATVRAQSGLRVLTLSAADFRRSLAPYVGADAALRARLDERDDLNRVPLFSDLGGREKELLLARLRTVTYAAGQTVVREGDSHGYFYCIRSGRVEVIRADPEGYETHLATLGPGEFFGEIALVLGIARTATVRALEPTQLWFLNERDFEELLARYFNLASTLADVSRTRLPPGQVLLDFAAPAAPGRSSVGAPAPEFRLESLAGGPLSLADLRGGPMLLWLSHGFTDPACLAYAARLEAAQPALEAAGVRIVQIVPDQPEQARDLVGEAMPPYTVLCDPTEAVYLQYDLYPPAPPDPGVPARSAEVAALGQGSWLRDLRNAARADVAPSRIGRIREGLLLVDAQGIIRDRRVAGPRAPLPDPSLLSANAGIAVA